MDFKTLLTLFVGGLAWTGIGHAIVPEDLQGYHSQPMDNYQAESIAEDSEHDAKKLLEAELAQNHEEESQLLSKREMKILDENEQLLETIRNLTEELASLKQDNSELQSMNYKLQASKRENKKLRKKIQNLMASNININLAADRDADKMRKALNKLEHENQLIFSCKAQLEKDIEVLGQLIKEAIHEQEKTYSGHVNELIDNLKQGEVALKNLRRRFSRLVDTACKNKALREVEITVLSSEVNKLRRQLETSRQLLYAQSQTANTAMQEMEKLNLVFDEKENVLAKKEEVVEMLTEEIQKKSEKIISIQEKTKNLLSSLGFEAGKSKDDQKTDYLKMVAEKELRSIDVQQIKAGTARISKGLTSILQDGKVIGRMLEDLGKTSDQKNKWNTIYKLFMVRKAVVAGNNKATEELNPLFNRYTSLASEHLADEKISELKLDDIDNLENPLALVLFSNSAVQDKDCKPGPYVSDYRHATA